MGRKAGAGARGDSPISMRSSTTPLRHTAGVAKALRIARAMFAAFVALSSPRLTPQVMCVPVHAVVVS